MFKSLLINKLKQLNLNKLFNKIVLIVLNQNIKNKI